MIKLVYDCIRDPYDIANVLQVILALGDAELYFTGNSIRHDHPKVITRMNSWSSKIRKDGYPLFPIRYVSTLEDLVQDFQAKGIRLIGTSPAAKKSFYDLDLEDDHFAIVFGTERSGLSKMKAGLLDDLVKVPMNDDVDFMTLSVVTPIVAYEAARQQGRFVQRSSSTLRK